MWLEIVLCVVAVLVLLVLYLVWKMKEVRGSKTTWKEIIASQGPKTFYDLAELNKKYTSIIDIIKFRAKDSPDRVVYIWLNSKGEEIYRLTCKQLWLVVSNLGAEIRKKVGVGNCAMLIIAPSLEYNVAFLACLYGGVVAVPVYPPKDYKKQIGAVDLVAKDCGAKWMISTKLIYTYIQGASLVLGNFNPRNYKWFNVPAIADLKVKYKKAAKKKTRHRPKPNELAYLQYTSGSTSTPKGVQVSHLNYMRSLFLNLVDFHPHYQDKKTTYICVVGWIPSYHDTGLILFVMSPIYCGYLGVLFSPFSFLGNPGMWIEVLNRYNCNMSVAPNFGYDLAVKRTTPEFAKNNPIPSHCRLVCGAEPIQPRTMKDFAKRFNHNVFTCGYGLAEFTLTAAMTKDGKLTIGCFDRAKYEKGVIEAVDEDHPDKVEIVADGTMFHKYGMKYGIVNPETMEEVESNIVGELMLSDESKALGYLNKPEATKKTFECSYMKLNGEKTEPIFLRTGDLCFVHDDLLYICGRIKDIIIVRGRNLYPHDIEKEASDAHEYTQPSSSIAFSVTNYDGVDVEQLVIVSEIKHEHEKKDLKEVFKAIKGAVAENFSVLPNYIVLIPFHALPRTSSHKVARMPCKKKFIAGELDVIKMEHFLEK